MGTEIESDSDESDDMIDEYIEDDGRSGQFSALLALAQARTDEKAGYFLLSLHPTDS